MYATLMYTLSALFSNIGARLPALISEHKRTVVVGIHIIFFIHECSPHCVLVGEGGLSKWRAMADKVVLLTWYKEKVLTFNRVGQVTHTLDIVYILHCPSCVNKS
jgi:hypothetical protein